MIIEADKLRTLNNKTRENKRLRELLWASHPCEGKYGDDGELQCGRFLPTIDFKRDSIDDIETKCRLHSISRQSLKDKYLGDKEVK